MENPDKDKGYTIISELIYYRWRLLCDISTGLYSFFFKEKTIVFSSLFAPKTHREVLSKLAPKLKVRLKSVLFGLFSKYEYPLNQVPRSGIAFFDEILNFGAINENLKKKEGFISLFELILSPEADVNKIMQTYGALFLLDKNKVSSLKLQYNQYRNDVSVIRIPIK